MKGIVLRLGSLIWQSLLVFIAQIVWGQALFLPPSSYGNVALSIPEATSFQENVFQTLPAYEPVLDFSADSALWKLARPIGRLDILLQHRDGRRLATYCTASLIDSSLIMTSHHCIPGIDPNFHVAQAQLRMDYLAQSLQGETFAVDINPVETNVDYDYSILQVADNPGDKYGIISLRTHAPEIQEPLFLIHHPQGNPKQVTRLRCQLHNSLEAVSLSELRHRCDSQGGSSGGLLFSSQDQQVLAMHWGGYDPSLPDAQRYNVAKRLSALISQSSILQQLLQSAQRDPNPSGNDQPPPDQPSLLQVTTSGTHRASDVALGTSLETTIGFLDIDSSPQGAEVYYGDTLLGVTPLRQVSLDAGEYQLRLVKLGYDMREVYVTIAPNRRSVGTVPLLLQEQGDILHPRDNRNIPHVIPQDTINANPMLHNGDIRESVPEVSPLPVIPSQLHSRSRTEPQDNAHFRNMAFQDDVPDSNHSSYDHETVFSSEVDRDLVSMIADWDVIAQGRQSSMMGSPRIFTLENSEQLFHLWGQAYAGALRLPPLPRVDFEKQHVLAIFAGTQDSVKNIVVERISLETIAQISLRLVTPQAPANTGTLGTSPWIFVRLPRDKVGNARVTLNNRLLNVLP